MISVVNNRGKKKRKKKKKRAQNVELLLKLVFICLKKLLMLGKLFDEVSGVCPDKQSVFLRTIAGISSNLNVQLIRLEMDESTDLTDTAQFLIFVRGVEDNFELTEQLAGLYSMQSQTTGKAIANQVNKCVTERLQITYENLVVICTDGAPSMCGKNIGAVTLVEKLADKNIINYLSIKQRCKVLNFDHMSGVVSIGNYIRSRGLKH
ncbi:hypothetical protein PR048_026096, partial [Dryococelus australis]